MRVGLLLRRKVPAVRWPFDARIDKLVASTIVGAGLAIGGIIIGAYAANHGHHYRWWWPSGWMFIPCVMTAIGVVTFVVPLRQSDREQARQLSRTILSRRVHDLSATKAGVHLAGIWTTVTPGQNQPEKISSSEKSEVASYVPRAHDDELQRAIALVLARGKGLVWLQGRSCTGKTRSAWQALARDFGDWAFADCSHPDLLSSMANAPGITRDVVLWLDDVQRLAETPGAAARLRMILGQPGRSKVLAVATSLTSDDEDNRQSGGVPEPSSWRAEFEALRKLATARPITVRETWDPAEIGKARQIAVEDPLVASALRYPQFSPPQVLAGVQWAIEKWKDPDYRGTEALLTAAIDLSRILGRDQSEAPILTEMLLRECAPSYFERPSDPGWFERSLREATTACHDAVWALVPESDGCHRLWQPLLEYGQRELAWEPVRQGVWEALARAPLDRWALSRLANRAGNRMLYALQAKFEEAAAKAAEPPAQPRPEAPRLIGLQAAVTNGPRGVSSSVGSALTAAAAQRRRADQLLEADDAVGLRALAEPSNDPYVRRRLAGLYARRHDVQTLKDLGTFSKAACKALAQLLADDGAIEELCRQVVCGNGFARHILESRPIVGLADDERAHILKFGLCPNGTTASGRHVS